MDRQKVLVLGATGFVGKNILLYIENENRLEVSGTSTTSSSHFIEFDILQSSTWKAIADYSPDIIIDASGYGVIKDQTDLDRLYRVNYLAKREFIDFLFEKLPHLFWVQIGTAFEYSLEQETINENSKCFPKTHYGISKLLFSTYLQDIVKKRFILIRPFGMFGEGEDVSKFFPLLIKSQIEKRKIDLSDGKQERDYFYVKDLARFISKLIVDGMLPKLERETINLGSGQSLSLRQLSQKLAMHIPDFDTSLWKWGAFPQRREEASKFYNASLKATTLDFELTPLDTAFKQTVQYYLR